MNPKLEIQSVARASYANYLKKSDECFRAAQESFSKGDWNAAAICGKNEELKKNASRFRNILNVKNMAEYEERLVRRAEAERAMKYTERFLAFVRSRLPER